MVNKISEQCPQCGSLHTNLFSQHDTYQTFYCQDCLLYWNKEFINKKK